ncbi:MAG: di-trans,poly-cis-decaprenylcistransferase [Bacteriovoracaceae bacterium]|nr:di-trans,poly-cis-decaprenylcistransferase [Bacteriovoracaceae bacterium]
MSGLENKIKHVAIIMDGNGRWAQGRCRPRIWGHVRGSSVVSNIVEEADDLGLRALTLYAFSTENWSRPPKEVMTLFNLLKKFLLKEKQRILKNGVRFKVIGDISTLPDKTKELIVDLENLTKDNKGLILNFAFGYGGRSEIVSAVNRLILNGKTQINERDLTEALFAPESGDVDLLIRTGGDQRVSNFLLWQIAYAELFFTSTKWPDFTREEFRGIIYQVTGRERRFGQIESVDSLSESHRMAKVNKELIEKTSPQVQ